MNRLTLSISPERCQALKEAAARRGSAIGSLIDAALENYGIKTREQAAELVRRARIASNLNEGQALNLALAEQGAAMRHGRTRSGRSMSESVCRRGGCGSGLTRE